MLVLPSVAGIALLSLRIVHIAFGDGFLEASQPLRILVFALIFMFLNVAESRMMLVHDRQHASLAFLILSTTVNIVAGLALIPQNGAVGAALARLLSAALYFFLNHLYVSRHLSKCDYFALILRPLVATLLMIPPVYLAKDAPLLIPITVGASTYVAVLWALGGISVDDRAFLRQVISDRCGFGYQGSKR